MDRETDVDDDVDPWTPAGAAQLIAAGDALADAVREHARALAALTNSRDIQAVFVASDVLLPVVLAYADAQFNLTGNGFPFGPLHDFADDEDEDEDEQEEDAAVVGTGLSVVSRQDFVVTDESAVLADGRAAHQSQWRDEPRTAAV